MKWPSLSVLVLLFCVPLAYAATSSGEADVNNISPSLSVSLNRARTDDYYQITITVEDNNTLNDLVEIEVAVWHSVNSSYAGADDSTKHYTFKWNSSGWTEETLSGHLASSTEPGDLSVASDTWTANLSFTSSTLLGNYTIRSTVDDGSDTDTSDTWVMRDKLSVVDYERDVENRKLYARLQYASDSTDIENGTVSYVGLTATANSTGWAEFDLSSASDYSWNTVCYLVEDDDYEVTEIDTNQSIPLAKAGAYVIGGNATVDSASWSSPQLFVTFNLSSGSYTTTVSGAKPRYVIGDTYDLDTDYTSYLSLDHDAQLDFTIGYPDWGDTYVRALTYGWFESASLSSDVLTLLVNGSSGSGTAYVDCSGRGSPQRFSGFDTGATWFLSSTDLFWGDYTLGSTATLTLDWSTSGGGSEGGSSSGGTSALNVRVSDASVSVNAGSYVTEAVTVTWSGTSGFYITGYNFPEPDWFTLEGDEPLRIDSPDPIKSDTFSIKVDPPIDAEVGNRTISYGLDLRTATGGTVVKTSGIILVDVLPSSSQGSTPVAGPVPNTVGLLLGIGLAGTLGYALFIRKE